MYGPKSRVVSAAIAIRVVSQPSQTPPDDLPLEPLLCRTAVERILSNNRKRELLWSIKTEVARGQGVRSSGGRTGGGYLASGGGCGVIGKVKQRTPAFPPFSAPSCLLMQCPPPLHPEPTVPIVYRFLNMERTPRILMFWPLPVNIMQYYLCCISAILLKLSFFKTLHA